MSLQGIVSLWYKKGVDGANSAVFLLQLSSMNVYFSLMSLF